MAADFLLVFSLIVEWELPAVCQRCLGDTAFPCGIYLLDFTPVFYLAVANSSYIVIPATANSHC